MPNLTIELDDQTLQDLRRTATMRQESLAQVVRAALHAYAQEPAQPEATLPEIEARHRRIHQEAVAWRSLPVAERQRYGTDFVAVLQGRVLDHDPSRVALVRRVRAQFDDTPVLITPAASESPREFHHISLRRSAEQ